MLLYIYSIILIEVYQVQVVLVYSAELFVSRPLEVDGHQLHRHHQHVGHSQICDEEEGGLVRAAIEKNLVGDLDVRREPLEQDLKQKVSFSTQQGVNLTLFSKIVTNIKGSLGRFGFFSY